MTHAPIHPIANFLQRLSKRQSYAAACIAGILLTLAFPPFNVVPLLVVAFPILIWLLQGLDGKSATKQAFALGWWSGLGHHVTGLYWITIALGIDGVKYLWVVPFALLLLPAYLSLFIGLATVIFHKTKRRGHARLIIFAVMWVVGEYLRSVILGGFPWNLLGYVWTVSSATLQPAALFGVYGLSLWAVALGVSFSLFSQGWRSVMRTNALFPVILLAITMLLSGWGYVRLNNNPMEAQDGTDPSRPWVRVVQANVMQEQKWNPDLQREAVKRHLDLSRGGWVEEDADAAPQPTPDYIIWPETAMPYPLRDGSNWVQTLGTLTQEGGALVTGSTRVEGLETQHPKIWNSVQAVSGGDNPQIFASYDKTKLVPFGEFMPMRWFFDWFKLDKVTHGTLDFSEGEGATYIRLPGKLPMVQPLICYETIFPYYRPIHAEEARPDWLLNVTNDAWFGNSTGPYQHFQMARTRAVERGVPMIRAANSGISGAMDGYGRVINSLELNATGAFTVSMPHKTIKPTLYDRYSEFTVFLMCYLLLLYVFRLRE